MTLRVLWGVCLALAAMTTGIGIELHLEGAGPWVSYPVVAAGILVLPLASTLLERTLGPRSTAP